MEQILKVKPSFPIFTFLGFSVWISFRFVMSTNKKVKIFLWCLIRFRCTEVVYSLTLSRISFNAYDKALSCENRFSSSMSSTLICHLFFYDFFQILELWIPKFWKKHVSVSHHSFDSEHFSRLRGRDGLGWHANHQKEISRFSIYLKSFFIHDFYNLGINTISTWTPIFFLSRGSVVNLSNHFPSLGWLIHLAAVFDHSERLMRNVKTDQLKCSQINYLRLNNKRLQRDVLFAPSLTL